MTQEEQNIRILLGFILTAYFHLQATGSANTDAGRSLVLGGAKACQMLGIDNISDSQARRLIEEAMKSIIGGELTDAILGAFEND